MATDAEEGAGLTAKSRAKARVRARDTKDSSGTVKNNDSQRTAA